MAKRFICIFIIVCSVTSFVPTMTVENNNEKLLSLSADSDVIYPDVHLGTSDITAGKSLYLGKYTDNAVYPVPWIVLGSDMLIQSSAETGGNVIALFSKYLLGTSTFRATDDYGYYNYSTVTGSTDGSLLKQRMESLYNETSIFSSTEQRTIIDATLNGASMYDDQSDLTGQKLFPISYNEAFVLGGNAWQEPIHFSSFINDPDETHQGWHLRTSFDDVDNYALYETGFSGTIEHYEALGVRPACYFNLNIVSLTSAAVGGKVSGTVGENALHQNATSSQSNEIKLTLLDTTSGSGRENFSVATTAVTTTSEGGIVNVDYAGAKVGTNEYLSAVLVDNTNSILYYGRLKNIASSSDSSGSQRIHLPAGLAGNNYSLKVFNEEYNGDKASDYTSSLFVVAINIVEPLEVTPSSVSFTTVPEGYDNPETKTITLKNNLSTDILAGEVTITSNSANSAFDFPASVGAITAGNTLDITVSPKPGLHAGEYNETLSFVRNNVEFATVTLHFTVIVTTYANIEYQSLHADTTLTAVLVNGTAGTYQWQLYNNLTSAWEDVTGATTSEYNATREDVDKQIRVLITDIDSNVLRSPSLTIEEPIISISYPVVLYVRMHDNGNCFIYEPVKIVNNSTVDVHLKEIRLDWYQPDLTETYKYPSLVTLSIKLGGTSGSTYSLNTLNPRATIQNEDGFIAKNGGELDLPWEYSIGTGNCIIRDCEQHVNYIQGDIYYTVE